MKAAVIFNWKKSRSERAKGEGLTHNISIQGVFVQTETPPPVSSVVEIRIYPPASHRMSKSVLSGKMKVARVEQDPEDKGRSGFAANGKLLVTQSVSRGESRFRTQQSTHN